MLERVDRYELKERIGVGGQATVYLGEDTLLGRTVAVKVMNQMVSSQREYVDALMSEARLAAGLSHQNIVTVYDFKVEGDVACIVMEYVPNSLDKELASNGPMSPSRTVDVAIQICDALSYAHSMGFVHRDIKPHNILLTVDGSPKITDFGIARATDISSASALGTPLYMSPEQCIGKGSPDIRSDIYSIGVTLYAMLAGSPPFQGNVPQLYEKHLNEPMPDFPSAVSVPSNLAEVVRRCMEKDPDARYQSAQEMVSALKNLSGQPLSSGARGAAHIGQQRAQIESEDSVSTGRDWRRLGRYTVLGEIGPDDRQGIRRHVQVGADEVVIVRKNGEIADVFSEDRKPTRSFGESLKSLIGLGPNIKVYKASKTRFNIIFWLGDDDTVATGNKSFTFGLPVMTSDHQVISAKINLWIEVDEELAENILLLLRGENKLNRFDIASEIRDDLLAKVLGLELNQYTFDELRGNRALIRDIGEAIQREISSTLGAYGLRIQDYAISWGLTLSERDDIDQQRHQISLDQFRALNEIDKISDSGAGEQGRGGPIELILKPSGSGKIIAVIGLVTALIFLAINSSHIMDQVGQTLGLMDRQDPFFVGMGGAGVGVGETNVGSEDSQEVITQTQPPASMIAEASESAYAATSLPLRLSTDGTVLEAVAPQEKEANLTHVTRIRVRSANTAQDTEVVVRRLLKDEVPTGPSSVLVLRNLDITLKGIKNSGQTGGEIEFEVKRGWLQDQDIEPSNVSLYRLHDEWEELLTDRVGQSVGAEDQLYEHYLAQTPGFSVFAIGVSTKPVVVQPPLASPTPGPIPQEVVLPKPTPTPLLLATPEPTPTPTPTATSLLATPEPTPTPTPTSRPTATSPPSLMGGRIVFYSYRDGNDEIYVMNPDGSGQTRLTDNVAGDLDPSWSPGGSRIAFASHRDGKPEIYVMNADGSGQIRLTDNVAEEWHPAWSPDGGRITFVSDRDGNLEIYVMNADGSRQTRLTSNDAGEWNPAWSPDGSRITFVSDRDGNPEIYVMNADGSGQINLTNNIAEEWNPAWSPDGSRIAFASTRDGNDEIYVMNPDGSGQTRLTDNVAGDLDPSWSPDGSRITFVSDRDGNPEIYVMNADGSGQIRLTNNNASNMSPDWGPAQTPTSSPAPTATPTPTRTITPTPTEMPISVPIVEVNSVRVIETAYGVVQGVGLIDDGTFELPYVGKMDYVIAGSYGPDLAIIWGDRNYIGREEDIRFASTSPAKDNDCLEGEARSDESLASYDELEGGINSVSDASALDWKSEFTVLLGTADSDCYRGVLFFNVDDVYGAFDPVIRDDSRLGFSWYVGIPGQTDFSRVRYISHNEVREALGFGLPESSVPLNRIAFSSDRDGNYEIYVMNADGSGQTRLTDNGAFDGYSSWSPDGSRIAFTSDRDGNDEIYVMNADGSGHTRLTNNDANDEFPSWSLDGSRIAFTSDRDGNYEIYVMNTDGSGQTRLTENDALDVASSWSPDGSRITFLSDRDGNHEIYVMNFDGSGQTRLTDNDASDTITSWSPSYQIVFTSVRDGNYEIYVMDPDGSRQTRLTNNDAYDSYSSWSPDGSRIVFQSDRDGNHEIYVMNADGSGQTRLTDTYADNRDPDWGPDWMEIDENSFVNFPDEALEAAVIDSLGKGLKGQITLEDLAALTEMNADSREISNLSGIEHAVNLKLLEISSNPISDYSPLASLTKLEHLNITAVGLSDLSFLITLKNLKQLTLHANEIADISLLSHLTALEYLNLDRNNVVDITPLLSLNSLETLILVDNALLNTESLNKHVPNLMSRGVEVMTGCHIDC